MVKMKHKVNIRKIFLGLQSQMRAKLSLNRRILNHPVAKGDACELEWLDMLSLYLPKRYCAEKAFVIDCKGGISDQIDIVVFDRHYSPFILKQHGATYIPAESVYAVIEVKPVMNMKNLKYASNKAASVRRLHRTTATIVHAGGEIKNPKQPFDVFSGILSIDGKCTSKMAAWLKNLNKESFLNFGCSLDKEAFWLKKKDKVILIDKSRDREGLIFFFLNLLSELQSVGTVPAIDIQCYAETFKKD
jgi:hypothetical protein